MFDNMVSPDSSKKKVANLRVQDLKLELEKRGLDYKGVKAVLLERLQKALVENGEDPNEIIVDTPVTPKGAAAKKTPARKRVSKGKAGDEEAEGESDYEGEEGLGGDGMVVDEVTEDMETSQESGANKSSDDIDLDIILGSHEEDDDDVLNISLEEDQLFTEEETEGFVLDSEKASSNQEDKTEAEDSSPTEVEGSKDADAEDSLALDTSLETKGEGSESLVVHVDEPFMSELDEELAESATPKRSEDDQGDVSTIQEDDNRLAEATPEGQKEKGESESPEKANKSDKSPTGEAKEEKGDDKVTPAKASSASKDSTADKRGTSSAAAANSRSKSSSSSGRSPTSKDDKDRRGSGSSRPGSGTTSGRNLWVSNLSRNTRAADLKASFSKYGKVVGAKVVTNARGPRAFCYGFVSMSSSSEAAKAINHLHRTELHGRTIHVERARSNMIPVASTSGASGRKKEPSPERKETKDKAEKKPTDKPEVAKSSGEAAKKEDKPAAAVATAAAATAAPERKDEKTTAPAEKKDGETAMEGVKEDSKNEQKTPADAAKQTATSDKQVDLSTPEKKTEAADKKDEDRDENRPSSSRSSTIDKDKVDSKDRKDILSLEKIKEQRLRERQRKRERDLREMERRRERERQDSLRREREIIRRRQREEEEKLRRDREQLRLAQQQERLERQSIEWERMKLHQERENLQRELEQHRQMEVQLRLAAERQATLKRSLDTRNMAPRDVDPYVGDQKRRPPTGPQGRADFSNNSQNRGGMAISTHVVNPERPPDRFNRRDTRQTDPVPRRDNPPTNKFTGPPNRGRDDVRRNDQARRDEPRRDDARQRPPNTTRTEPMRRDAPPPRRPAVPPQQRPAPPPQRREEPAQQQRRDEGQRRGPDNFRRDDAMKRRDQPERRMDTSQKPPTRNEPRRDSRGEGNLRDDRRGPPPVQGDRYQGGQGQSRGGNIPSYGGRDGGNSGNIRDGHRERDRDDRADRSRESSHQGQSRMGGSHGGDSRDNWKGGRDAGASGPSGRSSNSHSDWKTNQRSGDRSYDRDNRSQNYDRGQSNNWAGNNRSGGRDDQVMRGSEQHSHRGSLLGTPPIQDTTWTGGNMDAPMHRGSGAIVMPGTSHISTLMNQSQPISSLLSSPSMSGPFISGGSVSGGLGSGVGMVHQVPLGSASGSSYIGNQIGIGSTGGSGSSMVRHRSSQSDGRFAMRRY